MREKLAQQLRDDIIAIAGIRSPVDTRESWLRRAARKAGIPYSAAKKLFYREAVNPRAVLVDQVRAAVARLNQEKESSVKNDYSDLEQRLTALEHRIGAAYADYDCVNVYRIGEDVYFIGRARGPVD